MQERGGFVDHTMVHRCLDETYIKVFGEWKYLYRAVDKCCDNTAAIESVKADPGVYTAYCASLNISTT